MSSSAIQSQIPASVTLLRTGQVGFELLGAATAVVVDAAITANSIVVLSGIGATNATAITFSVELNAGVGFTVRTEAVATVARKAVNFAVLKY